MRIALAVAAALTAALALGDESARATNECNGLMVCVRVAGPWVVVPTSQRAPRAAAQFQLSCPRRYIVGGLDVERSVRAIDVAFLGKTGSPVNPGITTDRAALFVATYTGTGARVASFRPHLGCMPASGGGGGPTPYRNPSARAAPAAAPAPPLVRRSRDVRVNAGTAQTVTSSCLRGEHVLGSWQAVGFYTAKPPAASLAAAVTARGRITARGVAVSVRSTSGVRGVRAIVQAGAVCGGEA